MRVPRQSDEEAHPVTHGTGDPHEAPDTPPKLPTPRSADSRRPRRRFTRSRRRIVITAIVIVLDVAIALYLWFATANVNFSQ